MDQSTIPPTNTSDFAAWAQAIGSILAIIAAAWIAIWQSRKQHHSALTLHKMEIRTARAEVAKTILVLGENATKVITFIAKTLKDRESVYAVANGFAPLDTGELERINGYLAQLPIHSLPHSVVTHTMHLGSVVRQCIWKVDMAIKGHARMDAEMYADFFQTLDQMKHAVAATTDDLRADLASIEREPVDGVA